MNEEDRLRLRRWLSILAEAEMSARILCDGLKHDRWREERSLTYAFYTDDFVTRKRRKPGPPPEGWEQVVENTVARRSRPKLRQFSSWPVWRIGRGGVHYGRMPGPSGFWA